MNEIRKFLAKVEAVRGTNSATEPSYRSALEQLLNSIKDGVTALNEPKRVACGAPDFIVQRGEIIIGHVEAKDLVIDLRKLSDANEDQKARYLKALPNLIYTNCLDWEFYRAGTLVASVSIASLGKKLVPKEEYFPTLKSLLQDFALQRPQTITSPKVLAEMMAGKASLIKDVLRNALTEDIELRTELASQYSAFREHLIHDISRADFADIYAETLAYGLFAARLHDQTSKSFNRKDAMELLPKSNPFLRNLFGYIARADLDERVTWIVDDLAQVFQATDMHKIMHGFGKLTGRNDPFLHFYETFLAAYNPAKRKSRGVWYTPEAVVSFIVRALDEVLRTEFGLDDGVADTSKVSIRWDTGQRKQTKAGKFAKKGGNVFIDKDVHRVQVLDPAVGTGTFLAEVVKQIALRVKDKAEGHWNRYVERDLIPRLHGFEILMASYAMCHTKLDMILTDLGYKPTGTPPRLSVYLTNSLEEGDPANQTLPFAQWLSNEVRQANAVKRDMPIMCVIGNPPYNSSSKNNNTWIKDQINVYKEGLGERKVNLDDDYIKFIRLAETFVERNGGGVVAMITNNSYLDGVTQRLMRKHLRETFDKIHILNLHGDIRNESTDAVADENVFDITQGVAVVIMVANAVDRKKLADVYYGDLEGSREHKYKVLFESNLSSNLFKQISAKEPLYRFVPDAKGKPDQRAAYMAGFPVNKFFQAYSSGVQTKRDKICFSRERETLEATLRDFKMLSADELRKRYELPKDGRDWSVASAKADVLKGDGEIVSFLYKPFDKGYLYYSGRTKGFVAYPRREIMQHVAKRENVCLITNRQTVQDYFSFAGVTDVVCNHGTFYLGNRGQDYCFPLYTYESGLSKRRRINLDPTLYSDLREVAKHPTYGQPDELATFDYIYGVLHCPGYRSAYADYLKEDFPRIPWPSSASEFWTVSGHGKGLRRLHLGLDKPTAPTCPFIGDGDSVVHKPRYAEQTIWINETQRFEEVPSVAWEFFLGGYQPAQKWLKDRRGNELSFEDIKHFQWLLKVLVKSNEMMAGITMQFATGKRNRLAAE